MMHAYEYRVQLKPLTDICKFVYIEYFAVIRIWPKGKIALPQNIHSILSLAYTKVTKQIKITTAKIMHEKNLCKKKKTKDGEEKNRRAIDWKV